MSYAPWSDLILVTLLAGCAGLLVNIPSCHNPQNTKIVGAGAAGKNKEDPPPNGGGNGSGDPNGKDDNPDNDNDDDN